MGQGLGKNAAVVLSLGKENYEALIERHGQWVRWRTAAKCPCVKPNSQQPDINCKKCGGLGLVYGHQKSVTVTDTVMVRDNSGIIELDSAYTGCVLLKVYDSTGRQYGAAEKFGAFVRLNAADLPCKGVYITAVMVEEVLRTIKSAACDSVGGGHYRVRGLRVSKTTIEGLHHTVPCDIEHIGRIVDAAGKEYRAKELRQDCLYIEAEEGGAVAEPVREEDVSYIPPFTFVLLGQELSKTDAQVMHDAGGDAVLTFPYGCDVSNDDVITVLSGTYTKKCVVSRKSADYDVIPAYFVEDSVSCMGREREYRQGTDFLLVGANRIKWLCADCPAEGEAYSLTYRAYPTYKVVRAIPQIRTSENQRMPKKAVVKLYDTYGERRGINRQEARA